MKKLVLLSFAALCAVSSFAQKKSSSDGMSYQGGLEIGMPMGDLGEATSFGIGASGKVNFPMGDKSAITGSVGYMTFLGKTVLGYSVPSFNVIPVKVGFKYMLSDAFYAEPQIGYSFTSSAGESTGALTYAGNLGYIIGENLDISARYEAMSKNSTSLSFIGLRVGYSFGR
jgi:Outer membrane protein beta-barrel domain